MPQLVWIADADGTVGYYNSQYKKFDGIGRTPSGEWTWQPVIHPDELELTMDAWKIAVASGKTYECEHRIRMADGTYRWHLSRAHRSRHGRWFGTATDIHELKEAQEELREREERFRIMGEAVDYGVWLCDRDGRCRYVSRSFRQLLQMSMEEISANGWSRGLIPEDVKGFRKKWKECIRRESPWECEFRVKAADGSTRTVLSRGKPVRNTVGEVSAWVGINLDITDRKQLLDHLRQVAEELAEANRRKDQFLATLAHELRNPLAPIRTGLELMKMSGDDRRLREETREIMENQTRQLIALVDDLLDVSRITLGKLELRKRQVDLASVVRDAVAAVRPFVEEGGHDLRLELPQSRVVLDADPNRLVQILCNLLTNAAKYTPRPGRIDLSAELQPGWVLVVVRDSGKGIPLEHQQRIFEMFAQCDPRPNEPSSGLGIGLTLVRSLTEMHGGTISVISDGENRGSEFRVRLPLCPSPELDPNRGSRRHAIEAGPQRRVLVVDDNRTALHLLTILVKKLGHDVLSAADGWEACRVAGQYLPEVIIMDLGMPVMDGYEAARRIRSQPWGRDIFLIALSGWGQEDDKRKSREAGFDRHLVKPLEPATLTELLSRTRPAANRSG